MPVMRRVFAVVLVALVSLGVSAWLITHYDEDAASKEPVATTASTTTAPGSGALVVVPTELGKNGFLAGVHLKQVGLTVSVTKAPSVSVPTNYVISQRPEQGTEVPAGTLIELTLSSGPP